MMRTMSRTGESIGRLDIAIAVALSALGLLLMYGNVTDAEVDASWLAMPVFLGVTIPVLWRRAAPLQAMAAVAVVLGDDRAQHAEVPRAPCVGLVVAEAVVERRRADDVGEHDRDERRLHGAEHLRPFGAACHPSG